MKKNEYQLKCRNGIISNPSIEGNTIYFDVEDLRIERIRYLIEDFKNDEYPLSLYTRLKEIESVI